MKKKEHSCFVFMRLLTFVALTLIHHNAISQEKVTITAFSYPPYMDENLTRNGLFCELAEEAWKAAGLKPVFRFFPLKRSTYLVSSGKELCQLGTEWNFTANSRDNIEALPMFYYRVVGFYLKDRIEEIKFENTADLRKYRIGAILGSSDAQILKNAGLMVHEVHKMELIFDMLYHKKRFDMVTAVELSGLFLIKERYPEDIGRWSMTEDAVQGLIGQIVFSKKYPDYNKYVDKFKKGFQIIRLNGEYNRILEKYYGKGRVPKVASDLNKKVYNLKSP